MRHKEEGGRNPPGSCRSLQCNVLSFMQSKAADRRVRKAFTEPGALLFVHLCAVCTVVMAGRCRFTAIRQSRMRPW